MAIFDAEEQYQEPNKPSKVFEVLAPVGGCLLYIAMAVGGVALLVTLFRGIPWYEENVHPVVSLICVIATIVLVPVSFLLAVFRSARPWAGLGFTLASYAWGLDVWLSCVIAAYYLAGVVWMIIGVCFAGIGIVPVAIIAALVRGEWFTGIFLAVSVAIAYGLRMLGHYLIGEEAPIEAEQRFLPQSPSYDDIISDYGLYIEHNPYPPIGDAGKLPHPRDKILEAMEWKEQELCDQANIAKQYDLPDLPEIERYLNAVQSTKFMLVRFAHIEPDDQERVDYFNGYESLTNIPEDDIAEYMQLSRKYSKRANGDFGIERNFSKTLPADTSRSKILKYCSQCDEGFEAKFQFCPNCGGGLTAFEMNPVD